MESEKVYLIANRWMTPDGTVLWSKHRHDMVSHADANGKLYSIDGGTDYCRLLGCKEDLKDMCVYSNEPHSIKRQWFLWGTYGKYGKGPMQYISLEKMDTGHLDAILRSQRLRPHVEEIIKTELNLRGWITND
jgi:hypothetical protein